MRKELLLRMHKEECYEMDLALENIKGKACRAARRKNEVKKKARLVSIYPHRNSDGNNNTISCHLKPFAAKDLGNGECSYLVKHHRRSVNTTTMKKRSSHRVRRICPEQLPSKGNYYKKIGDQWGWFHY